MTFSDLMKVMYHLQKVAVVIGEDVIVGEAEALDNYLSDEVCNEQVKEINIEGDVAKVWLEE